MAAFPALFLAVAGIAVQHFAHRRDGLLTLALVPDLGKIALQAGDELGVGVLPVMPQRGGQVGAARLRAARGRARRQFLDLADFGQDHVRPLQPLDRQLAQRLQRLLLAVDQEQAARDRRARGDPVRQFTLIGMG